MSSFINTGNNTALTNIQRSADDLVKQNAVLITELRKDIDELRVIVNTLTKQHQNEKTIKSVVKAKSVKIRKISQNQSKSVKISQKGNK